MGKHTKLTPAPAKKATSKKKASAKKAPAAKKTEANAIDETPEDNGSMLDNTCVLWMSEFGNGSGHNTRKLHTVMAGNVGGAQMGRCIPYATGGDYEDSPASHNQIFVSLLNAFGFGDTQFGWYDGNVATGALSGLA